MDRLTNKKEADAQRKAYKRRMEQGYPRNIPEERFLKLAEYEDAEEDGRLVILPCNVGDTVFKITRHRVDVSGYRMEWEWETYVQPNYATRTLADREVQKQAIALLIEEKIITRDEILKEAIRDYNVFIPFDMFPVEVDNGNS